MNRRWSVGPDPCRGFSPLGTVRGAVSPPGASAGGGPVSIDDDSTTGRLASRPATAVSPVVGSSEGAVGGGSSTGCWLLCPSPVSAADRATTSSVSAGGVDETDRGVAGELGSPTCPGAAVDPGFEPVEVADRWTGTVKGVIEGDGAGTVASRAGDGPPRPPESVRAEGSCERDAAERATTRGAGPGVSGAAGSLAAEPVISGLPVAMSLVSTTPP